MSCVKTLCQCAMEGHFTRETLQKVVNYQHETWEQPLNKYIRKNAIHWDKVQELALTMALEHLQTNEDKKLDTFIQKYITHG